MQKKLIVLQDGSKECGSAALLSIIRYYGGNISLNRLVELTHTSKSGTSFYDLSQAAKEVGLQSKSYKTTDIDDLKKIRAPFICQFLENQIYHFVVVYHFHNKVTIMDPARGQVVLSIRDFEEKWTGYIMLFDKERKLPYYEDNHYLTKITLSIMNSNKKLILTIFSLSVIFTILSYLFSFHFKVIIDNGLSSNLTNLKIITFVFLNIAISKTAINYLREYLLIHLNQKLDLTLFVTTINQVLLLPYNYYKNRTTGEVISRINDLPTIKNMISQIILTVCLDLLVALVGGIIMFRINGQMFLIAFIMIILYIFLIYIFRPFMKKRIRFIQERNARLNSCLVETVASYETVKGLHLEQDFSGQLEREYLHLLDNHYRYQLLNSKTALFKNIVNYVGLVIIIYVGSKQVMAGTISMGSLVSFNTLLTYFLNPMQNILDLSKEFYYSKNALKRANNLLEIKSEVFDNAPCLVDINDIGINNLKFSFNDRINILNDISLNIPRGNRVLLLGPSGSGKSTLLKILYKYYPIMAGQVYLNGKDLTSYSLDEIRSNVTYVSQQELLYSDTIRNNILLGRNISDRDYQDIVAITHVREIINNLFLKDETKLEEGGSNLSGGQRQRIVLARSLIKPSSLIMIDEGLNEIDIDLERQILKGIFQKYSDKIIVIVSHRMDNMDLYNQVIKLNDGYVVDTLERNDN